MVHRKTQLINFAVCILCFSIALVLQVFGIVNGGRVLITEDNIELTIQSEDGEIIDCIDIKKQPAFSEPLLADDTIQMEPSWHPEDEATENPGFFQAWQEKGECREGTVPIARISGIFMNKTNPPALPQRSHIQQNNNTYAFVSPPGHEYAQVSLTGGEYYGARAQLNVWHPAVYDGEFSLAQIWVISGEGKSLNTIEAGWMVNSGDQATRVFIYWTRDGYQSTGCYNHQCPGFVQTNRRFAIGVPIKPLSTYNGKQYEIGLAIRKDGRSGNWWLQLNDQMIGYWPGKILTTLSDKAESINWGGEITNNQLQGRHTSTQMGSSHFPREGYGKAAYFHGIGYFNAHGGRTVPEILIPYATNYACYDIVVDPNRMNFNYGGPGFSGSCK